MHSLTAFRVDYGTGVRAATGSDYRAVVQRLLADLPPRWDLGYRDMSAHTVRIVLTAHQDRLVHLDLQSTRRRPRARRMPDRIVALFGRSGHQVHVRDEAPMRAYVSAALRRRGGPAEGRAADGRRSGCLDVSGLLDLAPASAGWSPRDGVVAAMERLCVARKGTFFFVRPIYGDVSPTPIAVEYGVLRAPHDLWVQRFV